MNINTPQYAILHHTGDASLAPQLQKVNAYHKLRFGMLSVLGYWVGYHYFIERDGSLTQTRADHEEGAHTRGRNLESLGVCFAGDFDTEIPTEAQRAALSLLLTNLAAVYSMPEFPLYYHFTFSDTHCPGAYFRGREWEALIIQQKITFLKRLLAWLTSFFQK